MTTDINMDLLADNSRLKEQVRELHNALGACLPLAVAWTNYYCADGYGRQGRRLAVHQEILDKAQAALNGSKPTSAELAEYQAKLNMILG